MNAGRFGRVITAMVTPFAENGKIDMVKAVELGRYLISHGSDGLVLAGTTGESPVLTRDQEIALFEVMSHHLRGSTLIFNVGTNSTRDDVTFIRRVTASLVPDAFMAVSPYYNLPPQEGLYRHFATIAEAADPYPVIIYNVTRSGNIAAETVLRLARNIPNIVAIKEASGNLEQIGTIIDNAPEGFEVISGDDPLNLKIANMGGTGTISVASHLIGEQMQEMYRLLDQGEVPAAFELETRYAQLYKALFMADTKSPMMIKAALNLVGPEWFGFEVGDCELPLIPPAQWQIDKLAAVMRQIDLLH